jgi:hypothetical protein
MRHKHLMFFIIGILITIINFPVVIALGNETDGLNNRISQHDDNPLNNTFFDFTFLTYSNLLEPNQKFEWAIDQTIHIQAGVEMLKEYLPFDDEDEISITILQDLSGLNLSQSQLVLNEYFKLEVNQVEVDIDQTLGLDNLIFYIFPVVYTLEEDKLNVFELMYQFGDTYYNGSALFGMNPQQTEFFFFYNTTIVDEDSGETIDISTEIWFEVSTGVMLFWGLEARLGDLLLLEQEISNTDYPVTTNSEELTTEETDQHSSENTTVDRTTMSCLACLGFLFIPIFRKKFYVF